MIENEPTTVEVLAALLQKTGKASFRAVSRGVTLRLPALDLCTIEAFVKVTGDNRNKVMTYLIRAGIESTKAVLDDATLDKIEAADKEARRAMFPEGSEEREIMDSEDDK